jgi:hypothetical protein
MSWVWHHWSMTLNSKDQEKVVSLRQPELFWNNNHELWGENFDVWGVKDMDKKDIPPITIQPL